MSSNLIWAFVAGIVAVIGWPIIKAILIFLLTLVTGLFGALTTAVNTLPAVPLNVSSPPAVSAPATTVTPVPATDPALLTAIVKMGEGQQQIAVAVGKNTEVLGQLVTVIAAQQQQRPSPSTPVPSCDNGCGRGEYLEIPPSR